MLLAEVARRGCHDRALRHDECASRLNGETDIFFTDEVERRRARGLWSESDARLTLESPRPEELVDPPGQRIRADAGRRQRPLGCGG
jgi:hypothetical protein